MTHFSVHDIVKAFGDALVAWHVYSPWLDLCCVAFFCVGGIRLGLERVGELEGEGLAMGDGIDLGCDVDGEFHIR